MKGLIILLMAFSLNAHAEKMKDFTLPMHAKEGNFRLQDEVKKKKVLLNFWATWCTSCIQELPKLEALKAKYGDKVTFVAVNAGEKSNLIERFLKKYKFSYTLLKDEERVLSKSVGVDSLPVTIVVDQDMNIAYRDVVPPTEL